MERYLTLDTAYWDPRVLAAAAWLNDQQAAAGRPERVLVIFFYVFDPWVNDIGGYCGGWSPEVVKLVADRGYIPAPIVCMRPAVAGGMLTPEEIRIALTKYPALSRHPVHIKVSEDQEGGSFTGAAWSQALAAKMPTELYGSAATVLSDYAAGVAAIWVGSYPGIAVLPPPNLAHIPGVPDSLMPDARAWQYIGSAMIAGAEVDVSISNVPLEAKVTDLMDGPTIITQEYGCTDYAGEWVWPQCAGGHFHAGVDVGFTDGGAAHFRTPVRASRSGIVAQVGIQYLGDSAVCIRHADGTYLEYGHLDEAKVFGGDQVKAGDVIGLLGTKGASTAPHLHLEARTDGPLQGIFALLDPRPYLYMEAAVAPRQEEEMLSRNRDSGAVYVVGDEGKRYIGPPEYGLWLAAGFKAVDTDGGTLDSIPSVSDEVLMRNAKTGAIYVVGLEGKRHIGPEEDEALVESGQARVVDVPAAELDAIPDLILPAPKV